MKCDKRRRAENVYVHAGICCLWNGKCRAHCHPNCHIHDVPNSVNSTRTVVYRNWSTRVSTAIIADANNYPQAPEGPKYVRVRTYACLDRCI
jgi:hypothetical protein